MQHRSTRGVNANAMPKSSNPLGYENARPVILYDVSIEDIEERKAQKHEFENMEQAALFLGVHRHKVMRGVGKRVTSLINGKEYAIREPKTNK